MQNAKRCGGETLPRCGPAKILRRQRSTVDVAAEAERSPPSGRPRIKIGMDIRHEHEPTWVKGSRARLTRIGAPHAPWEMRGDEWKGEDSVCARFKKCALASEMTSRRSGIGSASLRSRNDFKVKKCAWAASEMTFREPGIGRGGI